MESWLRTMAQYRAVGAFFVKFGKAKVTEINIAKGLKMGIITR